MSTTTVDAWRDPWVIWRTTAFSMAELFRLSSIVVPDAEWIESGVARP
ncbi:MAG: hypothetical protein ACFNME_07760 [Actinomyces dentalis]